MFPTVYYETINIGDKIGMWEVIDYAEPVIYNGKKHRRWLCKCKCGTVREVKELSLKQGKSTACGCTRRMAMVEGAKKKLTTHNLSQSRLYAIYRHMRNRCYNTNDIRYLHYGGRGIKVCDLWLNSFEEFAKWAFDNGYSDELSIDRIDVNKDYCPENCKWSTRTEQANNKTSNRKYTYNNETHTISEWATIYNINYKKLYKRLVTFGWEIERALTT